MFAASLTRFGFQISTVGSESYSQIVSDIISGMWQQMTWLLIAIKLSVLTNWRKKNMLCSGLVQRYGEQ